MKIANITLGLFTAATVFIVGCSAASKTVSEESLGLRNTDLYSEGAETIADKTKYSTKAPGTSQVIERAFENAPPMIPHSVDGMLPITINSNQCTTCHEPAIAKSMNATPIPKSHFTDFRPVTTLAADGRIAKEGKAVDNTSDLKTVGTQKSQLVSARYNCSACHAPQSMASNIPVVNVFESEFRTSKGNKQSNLVENINEGVDTIK